MHSPCCWVEASQKHPPNAKENKSILTEKPLKGTEFVIKNNVFKFNGTVKEQISGTAIQTKCVPSYPWIFISEFETSFIESQQSKPLEWFRYIDNIFFILTHGENKIKMFLERLNSFYPTLRFIHELSKESLPILDLKLKLSKAKISSDIYVKDINRHQYLHYASSYPKHTKQYIVYSQALRVKRICSEDKDFEQHIHEMRLWFQKRAYPNKILDEEVVKVFLIKKRLAAKKLKLFHLSSRIIP